jgi:anti-anti-sigma factor
MALNFTVKEKGPGILNVALDGTLDATTHDALDKRLDLALATSPAVLIFDFEKLEFISSVGLRLIAKTKKSLKEKGGTVMMVNLQPQIQEVFDIVKALPKEQIFRNIQELDDYLLTRQHMVVEQKKNQ